MFGIGTLILILIVALLIIGPKKLSKFGRKAGRAFRSLLRAKGDIK